MEYIDTHKTPPENTKPIFVDADALKPNNDGKPIRIAYKG
jgi:hypothetical protein